MDYLKIMKAVETLSIFICIFLITWSAGDGAPQWRPQGRFGKRFTNTRTASDIMSALQTVAEDDDQFRQMYMEEDPNYQLVNTDTVEELYSNPPSALTSSSSSSSASSTKWPFSGSRICIESSFPGVFRCHRRGRSGTSVATLQDE
ncbi:uncharacterized protein LOC123560380 isoform X1 [Mercenaria mercenaria]|uniref:uncharacterized protein LOC123560380 isoform X1 n=2 Tax=Mercenaria mercenaria TaxID=6596 RepID=UPI00234F4B99|nr:uncharacterized protein LOC123560380 isoform X1 [Mercenaria mercenaria]